MLVVERRVRQRARDRDAGRGDARIRPEREIDRGAERERVLAAGGADRGEGGEVEEAAAGWSTCRPSSRSNGSKSVSWWRRWKPRSITNMAMSTSMVLRIVTPRLRKVR
jgi:hypothetical protein